MAAIASDDFNRANGPLGANWTVNVGSIVIVSNGAETDSANDVRSSAHWSAVTQANDQYSKLELTVAGTSGAIGPAVRVTAGSNFYAFYIDPAGLVAYLFKLVGVVVTVLASTPGVTPTVGDILRLEVEGTALTAKRNGTALLTSTDSALATGNAGMQSIAGTADQRAGNWEGGTLAADLTHQELRQWRDY